MIKEVDFNDIKIYKEKNFSPVMFIYNKEAFCVTLTKKQIVNSWELFFKIFLNRFYNEYKDNIETNFIDKLLFKKDSNHGYLLFSHSDKRLNNRKQKNNKVIKFDNNSYVKLFQSDINNLVLVKKIIKSNNFNGLKLYVSLTEDINTPEFNKEYKKLANKYKKYNIKNSIFVSSHINGKILNDFEKLVKYVRDEFKTRKLIGDIKLTNEQEVILNDYMKSQLETFNLNPSDFMPEYPRLFALGLVRYAMRNYNKDHKGEFWHYFKSDFDVDITPNKQKYIHETFASILKNDNKACLDNNANKIDLITMHTFVSDNSASQLFDYLFDFWRLDLLRNVDNLNNNFDGVDVFNELIKVMEYGSQNVRTHTSQLLKFPELKPIFKNRIKRIFRLINDAFWSETKINETGNRINHLLNLWMDDPKGSFQKEKKYVAKHTSKGKGEILYHSPVLKLNVEEEKLRIILPSQRLIECDENDRPIWIIESDNSNFNTIQIEPEFNKDKIGYYIDKTSVEILLNVMLFSFKLSLKSNDKVLKKYEIKSSKIRFFDSNGKYIDHDTSLLPQGFVTVYSDSSSYPTVLGEETRALSSNGLFLKNLNLTKGQIVVLDDNTGIQVAQKLNEGYTESYPLEGLTIKDNDNLYEAYAKLPKLLFKTDSKELDGISLIINGHNHKVTELNFKEFRISDEVNIFGYLLDLSELIKNEGKYELFLSYPKYKKQLFHSSFVYIKDFKYSFRDSPYIFKEEASIDLPRKYDFIELNDNKWVDSIKSKLDILNFTFNFAERDVKQTNKYCDLVYNQFLVLSYKLNDEIVKFFFYIPALYYKFNLNDEWNVKMPQDILLKDLKHNKKKIYLSGPFNFNKISITTDEDVEIAEEESEIKCNDIKNPSFDLSKAFDWFNNRDETYRSLNIKFDEDKGKRLTRVICKSILNNVNLIADFDNNILRGDVSIYGNESYTISIKHDDQIICEDEQIVDAKFEVECKNELTAGSYEINVYEVIENESDGFDVETSSIILNNKPIIKKIINLANLTNEIILLKGYHDKNNKYYPLLFSENYFISNLKKTSYKGLIKEGILTYEDGEVSNLYGIWNEEIDYLDIDVMNSFVWYKGVLNLNKYGSTYNMSNALIMFTDKLDMKSMFIFMLDAQDMFSSLVIYTRKDQRQIITGEQQKKLKKYEKNQCEMFDDVKDYFLIDFKEETKYGV